jgi:hypothetical protein
MSWTVLAVGGENPLVPITSYGALGIIAFCFITGLVLPKSVVDAERARADRAEARSEAMLDDYKAVVPVLERALTVLQIAESGRQREADHQAEVRVLLGQVRDALHQRGRQ